jgi:hypothetical protein
VKLHRAADVERPVQDRVGAVEISTHASLASVASATDSPAQPFVQLTARSASAVCS